MQQTLSQMIEASILGSNYCIREHCTTESSAKIMLYNIQVLIEISEKKALLDSEKLAHFKKIYAQDEDAIDRKYHPIYRAIKKICRKTFGAVNKCALTIEELMP